MLVEVLEPAVLRMPELSDDAFFDFCTSNQEYRIERTAEGRIVIMPGTGGGTGSRNAELCYQLRGWTKIQRTGVSFDSSTMFLLPNSAMRSPDAAWVSNAKLAHVAPQQKEKFLPLCPEFVAELTSPSDRITQVRAKMEEWIANGVRLGWIIEPEKRRIHIYRADGSVEILDNLRTLRGEGPVDGFVLDFAEIWHPGF